MHRGSCLCKGVSFEAASLQGPYVYCHCASCQKASGTAFGANVAVAIEDFTLLSGEELIAVYESSPTKFRHFCRVCGSPLFTKVGDKPAFVRIRLGSLDTPFGEHASGHVFVAAQAPWHDIRDDAPKFPGWPDPQVLTVPGSKQGAR